MKAFIIELFSGRGLYSFIVRESLICPLKHQSSPASWLTKAKEHVVCRQRYGKTMVLSTIKRSITVFAELPPRMHPKRLYHSVFLPRNIYFSLVSSSPGGLCKQHWVEKYWVTDQYAQLTTFLPLIFLSSAFQKIPSHKLEFNLKGRVLLQQKYELMPTPHAHRGCRGS